MNLTTMEEAEDIKMNVGVHRNDEHEDDVPLTSHKTHFQICIVDLPTDLLFKILQRLPTVSLIACAKSHKVFANLINSTQFLNAHTRHVLGFPENQKDITYDLIPEPVAVLQNIWFQESLCHAAPYMVDLVKPGVIFYDLLCFKYFLETWLMMGDLSWNTSQYILQYPWNPSHCIVPQHMMHVLVKVALCEPGFLIFTLSRWKSTMCKGPPQYRCHDVWEHAIPAEWKCLSGLEYTFEVKQHQITFFLTCDSHSVIVWCGRVTRCGRRWVNTFGLGSFSVEASLNDMRTMFNEVFCHFKPHVKKEDNDNEGEGKKIPFDLKNPFLLYAVRTLILRPLNLVWKAQEMLEKTAASINKKVQRRLCLKECRQLQSFLDSIQFIDEEATKLNTGTRENLSMQVLSKTVGVAIQRYLHRYLNKVIGWRAWQLYQDPVGHRLICCNCRSTKCSLVECVGPQRIPFKIWPPHVLYSGMQNLPALAKLVCLDIELWKRDLLEEHLSKKVEEFVRQVLDAAHLHINLDPSNSGVIVDRLTM